jgi:hypothetical protein
MRRYADRSQHLNKTAQNNIVAAPYDGIILRVQIPNQNDDLRTITIPSQKKQTSLLFFVLASPTCKGSRNKKTIARFRLALLADRQGNVSMAARSEAGLLAETRPGKRASEAPSIRFPERIVQPCKAQTVLSKKTTKADGGAEDENLQSPSSPR